jgi:hypothetical protein
LLRGGRAGKKTRPDGGQGDDDFAQGWIDGEQSAIMMSNAAEAKKDFVTTL